MIVSRKTRALTAGAVFASLVAIVPAVARSGRSTAVAADQTAATPKADFPLTHARAHMRACA